MVLVHSVSGKTIGFIRVSDKEKLVEALRDLYEKGFTGRLQVVYGAGEEIPSELCLLVVDGVVKYVQGEKGPARLEDVVDTITREEGAYIEIVELERIGADMEKDMLCKGEELNVPLAQLADILEAKFSATEGEGKPTRQLGGAVAGQRGGEEKEGSGVETSIREAEERLKPDMEFVKRVSENRARAFHEILAVLRQDSRDIIRVKDASIDTIVEKAVELAGDGFTGIYARNLDNGSEALIVLEKDRLCYAVGRGRRGFEVLDREKAVDYFQGNVEYTLFPISREPVEKLLPECRRGGGEERSVERASVIGAIRLLLRGRKKR